MKKVLFSILISLLICLNVRAEVIVAPKILYNLNTTIINSLGTDKTAGYFLLNISKAFKDPKIFQRGWSTPVRFDACKMISSMYKEQQAYFNQLNKLTPDQRADFEDSLAPILHMGWVEMANQLEQFVIQNPQLRTTKQTPVFISQFK